jgi:hypothetical protein
MAFNSSGLFLKTFQGAMGGGTAIDVTANTIKTALYYDAITTPNYSTNTGYSAAPWSTQEVTASGTYVAGGFTLTSKTWTELNSTQLTFDADDPAWTTATITNAKGALVYSDSVTGKLGLAGVVFPTLYSSVAGTFTVIWDALGIFYVDCY